MRHPAGGPAGRTISGHGAGFGAMAFSLAGHHASDVSSVAGKSTMKTLPAPGELSTRMVP